MGLELKTMVYYRLYHLRGPTSEVESFHEFEADDDGDAIDQCEGRRGVNPMELWSGHRKVKRWDSLLQASSGADRT
jgi:hypothetical protein